MKVRIEVTDEVKYVSDIIIELPSYMSEDELNAHLDDVEKKIRFGGTFEDVTAELEHMGFDVKETISSFPSSPSDVECEITDYQILKDDA